MKYLDFHTHKRNSDDIVCINSPLKFETYRPLNEYFNIGLHPWRYQNFTTDFEIFRESLLLHKSNPLFLGAGEVGLDRSITTVSIESQIKYFEKVICFLKEQNINKLIIHSVKTHGEILSVLKKDSSFFKVCFHDFNGTAEEMNSLTKQLNCFFSIGPTFYKTNSKIQKNLNEIPKDRLFLESDEADYNIKDHYINLAQKLNMTKEELAMQCMTNLEVFKSLSL